MEPAAITRYVEQSDADSAQRRAAGFRSHEGAKDNPGFYVVTANDLRDGGVRYLRATEDRVTWTRDVEAATATADPERRDALLAAAEADVARNLVVAPYAIEVVPTAAGFAHTSVRERVRASGPSTGNALRHAAAQS